MLCAEPLMLSLRCSASLPLAFDPDCLRNLVGSNGLEPSTSRLSGVRSNHLSYEPMQSVASFVARSLPLLFSKSGGDEEDRTPDPLLARQVLSQLSYTPTACRHSGTPPRLA